MTNIEINSIIDIKEFILVIEKLVCEKKMEYIDAIVYYCEQNNMELETAAKLIKQNQKLKAKIRAEAEDLHYLPKITKLPF
jgi:hypothetical protein